MTTYSSGTMGQTEAPNRLARTRMVGRWSRHAYHRSPDGETLLHTFAGGRNHLALSFRRGPLSGIVLVDVDRLVAARAKGEPPAKEDYDREAFDRIVSDVSHTLWFSPRGTYLTGATRDAVCLRRTRDPREKPTIVEFLDEDENPREVRGVSWSDAETKLAVIVEDEVWVYDWAAPSKENARRQEAPGIDLLEALTKKRPLLRRVAKVAGGFLAEPQWVGDRVVFSHFEQQGHFEQTRERHPTRKLPRLELPSPTPKPEKR